MLSDDEEAIFALVIYAGELAALCERPEEEQDKEEETSLLCQVGSWIRIETTEMITDSDLIPAKVCTQRLEQIASQHGVPCTPAFRERALSGGAVTWRELQIAGVELHLACHPEIAELSWHERVCRHAIHFTATLGEMVRVTGRVSSDEECTKAFGDLMLLGVRLPDAAGHELPADPIPSTGEEYVAALRDGLLQR